MNILMDLHTHTIASGHGYSTLRENIEAAKGIGLKYLGFSEHGPAMPGGPHIFFFQNFRCIPRKYGDLELLCGVEANILDYEGTLDIPEDTLQKMDYVIASMHTHCVKPGNMEENTKASIQAMKNPYVTILGHPDDSRYPLDYELLVKTAGEEKVALEINNSSLHPQSIRKGAKDNILTLLSYCKKYNVSVLMGTDSHFSSNVGVFTDAWKVLEEAEFPKELIMNLHPESIEKLRNPRKKD